MHPGKLSYPDGAMCACSAVSSALHSGGRVAVRTWGRRGPDAQAEGQPASLGCRGPVGAVCDFRGAAQQLRSWGCSDGEAGRRKVPPPCSDWHCLPSSSCLCSWKDLLSEFLFLLAPPVPLLSPLNFLLKWGRLICRHNGTTGVQGGHERPKELLVLSAGLLSLI